MFLLIPKEKFTMESGTTIKLMVSVLTPTQMVPSMKVIGSMICNQAKGQRLGLMAQYLWEIIGMVRRMVLVSISGVMGPLTRVNGKIMKSQVADFINGLMVDGILVIGELM